MLVPDINDDGVVVARGIAAVVNRPEDDHYEVLTVVLNALHLLLDVPCVELWDILYFVPVEDVALLLRYSKRILCDMRLELPQVTIVVCVLFQEGRVWIGILEWLDVMLCQGVVVALCSSHFVILQREQQEYYVRWGVVYYNAYTDFFATRVELQYRLTEVL